MKSYSKASLVGAAATIVLLTLVMVAASPRGGQTETPTVDIQNLFTASGWMGDGEYGRKYVVLAGESRESPHTAPSSIKIMYTFGPTRWGGFYWQNQPDNWGDLPGNDYSRRALTGVTFAARGETGLEVVEFKVGGINNAKKKYRDSLQATLGRVALTKDWKAYRIDLSHADLSSVIGGFAWVASADYNQGRQITFFIDDIRLE